MRKLRVDWNSDEDSFLLLCKVAGSYLCQNMPNHMVPCGQVKITDCHFIGEKKKITLGIHYCLVSWLVGCGFEYTV
jgi:hypothetical protein